MGILEGAMMKLEDPRKGNHFRSRVSKCVELIKERLRHTALAVASSHCSSRLENVLGVMKSPTYLQESQVRIPCGYAALGDEARMREVPLRSAACRLKASPLL